jgi:hypothetical protein
MIQLDPWEKAAECQRALQATANSQRRQVLGGVRDLWIALANERSLLTRDEFEQQGRVIDRIHANLITSARTRSH